MGIIDLKSRVLTSTDYIFPLTISRRWSIVNVFLKYGEISHCFLKYSLFLSRLYPNLANKQSNALRILRHAVIFLLVNIILLAKFISSEYYIPFHFSY
jgi:hypothetical protein